MNFPVKLGQAERARRAEYVQHNPAFAFADRVTNPPACLPPALQPFPPLLGGEGRGEGERLNQYFPPAADSPLCHQHGRILTPPPIANRPERGVHAASAYKGTLASRIATTVRTPKRPEALVITHNFSFPFKGRLNMQSSQPAVRGSLGWSRLEDELVKRSPSPVSSPPGEDFPQTHFLNARPPVRPIQRLDLRNRLQPFPPLLGGEGRGEGERLNKIFPASDRFF